MDTREILEKVKTGEISVEDAESYFRREPFAEMEYAKLDTHRKTRSGFPEVREHRPVVRSLFHRTAQL